jgi:hypothetical protein
MHLSHTRSFSTLTILCGLVLLELLATGCQKQTQTFLSHSQNKIITLPVNTDFERGIVYPRWQPSAYGSSDSTWQNGIRDSRIINDPADLAENT